MSTFFKQINKALKGHIVENKSQNPDMIGKILNNLTMQKWKFLQDKYKSYDTDLKKLANYMK